MKNLIYQVWAGEMRPGCRYSEKLFRQYAQRTGADYRLDISPNIASKYVRKDGMYFEWLNPMLDDTFLEYDKVCVIDLDVYPVENLSANIFDEPIKDFGICTEPFQGKYRESTTIGKNINKKNDERWARAVKSKYGATMPRDANGQLIKLIRDKYVIDAIPMNKIQGIPFEAREIKNRIIELHDGE